MRRRDQLEQSQKKSCDPECAVGVAPELDFVVTVGPVPVVVAVVGCGRATRVYRSSITEAVAVTDLSLENRGLC
jgi:hypothetical protein